MRKAGPTLTREKFFGTANRWRRFGEPRPAGTPDVDGVPDFGLFGPGSLAWDVILSPTTTVFLIAAQGLVQATTYKPIAAGIRDEDPLTRKALKGELTIFDAFERAARNGGMHAPMWLGDTATAELMARHLHNIHKHVKGDVIDVGQPQLGGYAASEPRDAMWAAITEIHPMLWAYEAFAFRDGKLPRRLEPQQRDQYIREMVPYLRLVGADESEIPSTMAEVAVLYEKYEPLFRPSKTVQLMPGTGVNNMKLTASLMVKNFKPSHTKAAIPIAILFGLFGDAVTGAVSGRARWSMGVGPLRSRWTLLAKKLFLPLAWFVQQPRIETYFLRRMWGPDATALVMSARALHAKALAERSGDVVDKTPQESAFG